MSIIRKISKIHAEMDKDPSFANKDYNLVSVIVSTLSPDEVAQYQLEGRYYFDLLKQGYTPDEAYNELDKIVLKEQGYVLD